MKDRLLQIRVDDDFSDKVEYLQRINGYKSASDTVRKTIAKEWEKERPVKHGQWELVTDNRGQHFECPYCGEWKYHQQQHYCGNCGAYMD